MTLSFNALEVTEIAVLVAVAALALAWFVLRKRDQKIHLMTVMRWGLVVLGLAAALARAFPIRSKADDAYPVVDLTTLAFLSLIIVAFFLPRISKVTIGKTEIDLSEAVAEAEDTTDETANVVQSWMYAIGYAMYRMREATSVGELQDVLFTFLRDQLGDLKKEITEKETDVVRITLWSYDPEADELVFTFSNEIVDDETIGRRFKRRRGLVGQAFDEQRFWNEGEATQIPSYEPIHADSEYLAVAAAPVNVFKDQFGMFTLDKRSPGKFSDRAANLILGAANMVGVVIATYLDCSARPGMMDSPKQPVERNRE